VEQAERPLLKGVKTKEPGDRKAHRMVTYQSLLAGKLEEKVNLLRNKGEMRNLLQLRGHPALSTSPGNGLGGPGPRRVGDLGVSV